MSDTPPPARPALPEKRYYSIGEVADHFGITRSLIRFWEGEFSFLRPSKNGKGDRRFTAANIAQLEEVHHLVRERGFTLEGARREHELQRQRKKECAELIESLEAVRAGLTELRQLV